MGVGIIIPTRGRPHLLGPLIENISVTTPPPYRVVFVADPDDDPTWEVMGEVFTGHPEVVAVESIKEGLTAKTNLGVRSCDEPFVALVNDDVVFHERWWDYAASAFRDDVCVVGPSDTSPTTENGQAVTMPIVRRSYIEDPGAAWGEPGVAFYEGYHHNFCETELWQLAKARGVARFISKSVIEHRHPDWGTAGIDETYRRGAYTGWEADEALFTERQALWESAAISRS